MDKITQQKLEMWRKKESELQEKLSKTMLEKGIEAAKGDLSENAGYQLLTEDAETIRVQLANLRKIIQDLEKGMK